MTAGIPPRDGLMRMSPFALRAASDDEPGDGLTLDGYAAVFNRETVIDSWEGRFRERIANGAMKKSFRENPPRIQFDHGHHPLIGSIPIASLVSIREDTHPELAPDGGAHVIGRLHDNWLVEPVRDAIESGAVDGMSFRFSVVQDTWHTADGKAIRTETDLMALLIQSRDMADDELPIRTLRELRVPEVGPVVWPAYADTSVGVRSLVIDLGRLNEPAQRSKLAQAVFMADRATIEPEAPHATDTAGAHADGSTDTPPTTAPAAGRHESTVTPLDVRHALQEARQALATIHAQKGRYSS